MPRARRICAQSGCPQVAGPSGRCSRHAHEAEQARGSRIERHYGSEHQAIRRRLLREAFLAARRGTPIPCPRCGLPLLPSQDLDAAHTVPLNIDPRSRADTLVHRAGCNPRGTHPENRPERL